MSLEDLKDDAKPEDMDNDWLAKFFDKCKLVSNEDMQSLWARLLAGEANKPGSFSKRTVELVAALEKSDAELFTKLCMYGWDIHGYYAPLVYDVQHEIYAEQGLTFSQLNHLDDIGLVSFNNISGFVRHGLPKVCLGIYRGSPISIGLSKEEDNELNIGKVLLSKVGLELAPICGAGKSDEFFDYVLKEWHKLGYITWVNVRYM